MAKRAVVRVHGTVQGVGFRWAARDEAQRLGVAGSARNLLDGSVEVVVEGDDAAVDDMLGWLRQGPPSASVTGIDAVAEEPHGASGFVIR
ncbi:acylphosphatase [Agrococcus jejuensis]|uniref:acylphosphatase n=1 Tax=Agrococcus jejuensis TaxID=399736 RepID=UPI00119CDE0C|nr:acylphosphatase [Agrococcus jejuensis]